MRIELLLALIPVALIIRSLSRTRGYAELLSIAGVVLIFALQPEIPVRYLEFWLPVLTIALVVFSWLLVTPRERRFSPKAIHFIHRVGLYVILLSLLRYVDLGKFSFLSRPPQIQLVLTFLMVLAIIGLHIGRFREGKSAIVSSYTLTGLLLLLFIILKNETLSIKVIHTIRQWVGQSSNLAGLADLRWFGYSYIAFRLIHTLRDFQNNRSQVVELQDYFNYVLFFPTLAAGPIDRLERFSRDYHEIAVNGSVSHDLLEGGKRLTIGLFKKFFLADSLAVFAISSSNILQVKSTFWMWILLYAYAFQIYFDFSGYTDIAIGLSRIMGIHIPENFNQPYLKSNITLFWNSWHMTLTQWVRTYLFNPLTRSMRTTIFKNLPVLTMFIGQLTTMIFIGLWHGITVNFLLWGLWHALGLFLQNRWSNLFKGVHERISGKPIRRIFEGVSVVLTFHFVTLGWVWFALPDPEQSVYVLGRLFGWG